MIVLLSTTVNGRKAHQNPLFFKVLKMTLMLPAPAVWALEP
jgi:hypothetical protein